MDGPLPDQEGSLVSKRGSRGVSPRTQLLASPSSDTAVCIRNGGFSRLTLPASTAFNRQREQIAPTIVYYTTFRSFCQESKY